MVANVAERTGDVDFFLRVAAPRNQIFLDRKNRRRIVAWEYRGAPRSLTL